MIEIRIWASELFSLKDEDEFDMTAHVFRVNDKVKDLARAMKGALATGSIIKLESDKCDIKYDDVTTREGTKLTYKRT